MKIEIVKQRRKTMVLRVFNSEKAILKVPQTISEKKIEEFLNKKQDWLSKISEKMKINENFSKTFDFTKFIYIKGEKTNSVLDVSIGFSEMSPVLKSKSIKKYYIEMFSELEKFANKVSLQTNLKYKELKLLDSVRIWGSFNTKGQMKLNWKLIILPERLIYYVVCHELCHSIHMNHKPQFWKDIEKLCPNYKILKKELSQFSFVLKNKF